MKIHYARAIIFLLAMWSGGRKTRKTLKNAAKTAELVKKRNNKNKKERYW